MKVRVLIAALGASSVLVLAGCGGSSSPVSSGPASSGQAGSAPGQAPGSSQSAPAGGTSGSGKSIDVCAVLPATTASKITGTTLTTTKPNNTEGIVFGCEYGGPDSALLQISIDTQAGSAAFDADISALKTVGFPPTRISGVGDEAYSEPAPKTAGAQGAAGFASYGAVFGDTYIKIGGLTYVTADQGKQIVELLHSKL